MDEIEYNEDNAVKTPSNYYSQINPKIFSTQNNNKKTFFEQKEIKSINDFIDNNELSENSKNYEDPSTPNGGVSKFERKESGSNDKKSSFKKMMMANRSNLNPRLVTSTILNEHINDNFGDHRFNLYKSGVSIDSKAMLENSQKVNFKKVLKQKSTSRDSKK